MDNKIFFKTKMTQDYILNRPVSAELSKDLPELIKHVEEIFEMKNYPVIAAVSTNQGFYWLVRREKIGREYHIYLVGPEDEYNFESCQAKDAFCEGYTFLE